MDAFWRAGTEAGFRSDGEPGPRPQYHADYYGGFLLDPDGNSVEAVYHGTPRTGENYIDHLWIRVADLAESRRFYAAICPSLGMQIRDRDGRFHVAKGDRSFALVAGGTPTEHVHLAFPVTGDETVAAFHRDALAAGFRDNGAPGLRGYHQGYYAAFVLDPDGNNIEAVDHRGYGGLTPEQPIEQRRLPWLRREPLLAQPDAPVAPRREHALGVRVPPPARVALRRDQHVLRHRVQLVAAERAAVGRRLAVARAAHRPPVCRLQLRHRGSAVPEPAEIAGREVEPGATSSSSRCTSERVPTAAHSRGPCEST